MDLIILILIGLPLIYLLMVGVGYLYRLFGLKQEAGDIPIKDVFMFWTAFTDKKADKTDDTSASPPDESPPGGSPPGGAPNGIIEHWGGCNYTDECLPSFLCLKSNKNSQGGRCLTTADCNWAEYEDTTVGECDNPIRR